MNSVDRHRIARKYQAELDALSGDVALATDVVSELAKGAGGLAASSVASKPGGEKKAETAKIASGAISELAKGVGGFFGKKDDQKAKLAEMEQAAQMAYLAQRQEPMYMRLPWKWIFIGGGILVGGGLVLRATRGGK